MNRIAVLGAVAGLLIILVATAWVVNAQFSSYQAQIAELERQRSELENQIVQLQNNMSSLENQNSELGKSRLASTHLPSSGRRRYSDSFRQSLLAI